jgi:DNA (cytosine-5)-methyltransferase 1
MTQKKIKLVDLFSGCGGMSLGFQNAGFDVVAAYDNWSPAVDTYRKNFKHPIFQKDLSDASLISEIQNYGADIVIGGPPCQDFSIAGARNYKGHRANLTLTFAEIIANVQPQWFVMENVYSIEKTPVLKKALDTFKKAGYGITRGVFNASLMGAPQARKRYFVIGKLNAKDEFLSLQLEKDLAATPMTVRQYLRGDIDTEYYYMHPRSYKRRAIFSIDEPSSTIRGVNRPMPANYVIHNADKTSDTSKVRPLSSAERSYLQTFPKHFIFEGNKSSVEQQIGNAVPVNMAEYIAKHIIEFEKYENGR